jgi:hypothetical protein
MLVAGSKALDYDSSMERVRRPTCYLGHRLYTDNQGRQRCPICNSRHFRTWWEKKKMEAPFLKGDRVELLHAIRLGSGKTMEEGTVGIVTRKQNSEGVAMVLFEQYHTYLYANATSIRHTNRG